MIKRKNSVKFNLKNKKKWISCWYTYKKEYSMLLQEDLLINIYTRSLLFNLEFYNLVTIRCYRLSTNLILDICLFYVFYFIKKDLFLFSKNMNCFFHKKIYLAVNKLSLSYLFYNGFYLAFKIAKLVEKRVKFRSKVIKLLLQKVRKKSKGVYVQCAGRVNSENIASTDRLYIGSNPLHTIDSFVSFGQVIANTNKGLQCIKVWINSNFYVMS